MIAFYKRWRLRRKLRQAIDIDRKRRGMPLGIGTLHKRSNNYLVKGV